MNKYQQYRLRLLSEGLHMHCAIVRKILHYTFITIHRYACTLCKAPMHSNVPFISKQASNAIYLPFNNSNDTPVFLTII